MSDKLKLPQYLSPKPAAKAFLELGVLVCLLGPFADVFAATVCADSTGAANVCGKSRQD